MCDYEVLLGVDRAGRDTGRRMRLEVRERDPLSAAIAAEQMADSRLDDPQVEYTHSISVMPVEQPEASSMAFPSLAMAA